ncbi:MAG: sodium/glutamate symporter [Actinomycetaceae bacterium]|nr:sodium/glutamate symporter [Actinomycetaceae bacterium]
METTIDPKIVGLALLLLASMLLIGKVLRVKVKWIQNLFLPSAIVGGFLALFLGPEVLGQILNYFGTDVFLESGIFGKHVMFVWSKLPGLLISVVFATLFLGQQLPEPKKVVELAGPQLSVGVAFASGQYVVGLLLVLVILVPFFGISPMAGALIEIGFEGGHGTAGGMMPVFEELGWKDGADLAVGTATVGLVFGVILGVALINWAVRTGRTKVIKETAERTHEEQTGLFRKDEQYVAAHLTSRPSSIEPLSLHVAIVAVAILIGQVILYSLQSLEMATYGSDNFKLLAYVPLFPLAMIGGIILQLIVKRIGYEHVIDPQMMLRIQGLALDLLVVAALASISIKTIAANFWPFIILCVGGILINLFVLLWMCPRTIPDYWFERGIGDFGQSMGVTATGLILMRIVDPEGESPAFTAFGYKQLVFEPFFGGGLITALAVPLIAEFGPWPLFAAMVVVFLFAVVTGIFYWGKKQPSPWLARQKGTEFPPIPEP